MAAWPCKRKLIVEARESLGRIEVAPEVLIAIARQALLEVEGVQKMAPIPADMSNLFHRSSRHDGIVLNFEDNRLTFDIYVLMGPGVNIVASSKAAQAAIREAMDKMVGIPVQAVNIHVEDVVYGSETRT
jgi:uncharacterized alkaline shock family protein YloU